MRVALVLFVLVLTVKSLRAATGDEHWDDRFAPVAAGFGVSLAVSGTNVYAGGGMLVHADGNIIGIARWDGRRWWPLGTGVSNSAGMFNATVRAIAISGSNVYAGGDFTLAGGVTVNRIAKWDGTSWSALGSGVGESLNDRVHAIAVRGNEVYVGGTFTNAGGVAVKHIARWDGSSWSSLGTGAAHDSTSPSINAIAVNGNDVYVGGLFTSIDGVSASGIARWNGSGWSAVGNGVGGFLSRVHAIAVSGGEVYAGGRFTSIGGLGITNLAKWNGSEWSGMGPYPNGDVFSLALNGAELFVGGNFTNVGTLGANRIAKWNGSSWSALGTGLSEGTCYSLAANGTDLYAGGAIKAGDVNAGGIAKWDGGKWTAFGRGFASSSRVMALATIGTDVYAGGQFSSVGGWSITNVARWNGTDWSALGAGVNGNVLALGASGSNLHVGGIFTRAGGTNIPYIARWDGSNWWPLGTGITNELGSARVQAIAVSGSNVYVGGIFTRAGGVSARNIARWDGSNWHALDTGVTGGTVPNVVAIAISGSNVYVGGSFRTAGAVTAHGLAKWDGSTWSGFGTEIGFFAQVLAASGNDLYVGGPFTSVASVPVNGIARWNGSSWSALGNGIGGSAPGVYALAISGRNLYAGGRFTTAGATNATRIARWNGSAWLPLGSGMGPHPDLDQTPQAFAIVGGDLYVAGAFQKAGAKPSYHFGIWHAPQPNARFAFVDGRPFISWSSETGTAYEVRSTTDLGLPFAPLSGVITAAGGTSTYADTAPVTGNRFYQVVEAP